MKYFTKEAIAVRQTTHLQDVVTRKRPWMKEHADEFINYLQGLGTGPRNRRARQFVDDVPSLQTWRQEAHVHEAKYLENLKKMPKDDAKDILNNSTSAVFLHPNQQVFDKISRKNVGVRHLVSFRRPTAEIEAGVHGERRLAYVSLQPNTPSYSITYTKNRKRAPQINRYFNEIDR